MAENIYKATIDANAFDKMVKHMQKVLARTNPYAPNKLIECIHLDFQPGQVKCIAVDGYRIHEEYLSTNEDSCFSCYINPPRLSCSRAGYVTVSLKDGVAYVEFDNVRFATKQTELSKPVVGFEKIMELIGEDERFEVAVNPKYLLDAVNTMKSEKKIILNVGDPMRPITIRPGDGQGGWMCGILPVRRHYSPWGQGEANEKRIVVEQQRQKLKGIQNRLELLLSFDKPAEGCQEAELWSRAASFKEALDNYFKTKTGGDK